MPRTNDLSNTTKRCDVKRNSKREVDGTDALRGASLHDCFGTCRKTKLVNEVALVLAKSDEFIAHIRVNGIWLVGGCI